MEPEQVGAAVKRAFPQYADADEAEIGTKYLEKYGGAVSAVRSGQMDIKDIPQGQRAGVAIGLEAFGFQPKEDESAEEKKKKSKKQDVLKNLELLEKNYEEIKLRGPGTGDVATLLSNLTRGKIAPEIRDYEALRMAFIAPLARTISGEVGVLTDRDVERAEKLLPKVSEPESIAKRKLKNLREILRGETQPSSVEGFTIEAIE